MMFERDYHRRVRDQCRNVYALWLADELNKSVSCAVNLRVEGRAVSHTGLYLREEKASRR